jgi:hypothetical protein
MEQRRKADFEAKAKQVERQTESITVTPPSTKKTGTPSTPLSATTLSPFSPAQRLRTLSLPFALHNSKLKSPTNQSPLPKNPLRLKKRFSTSVSPGSPMRHVENS